MNYLVAVLRWVFTIVTESITNLTKREKRQVTHWLDATRRAGSSDDIDTEGEPGEGEENDVTGAGEGEENDVTGAEEGDGKGVGEAEEEAEEGKDEERKEELHQWKEGDSSQWVYRRFEEAQAVQMRHTSELAKLSEASEHDKKQRVKMEVDNNNRDIQIQTLTKQIEGLLVDYGCTKKWVGRVDRDRRSLESQVWDSHSQLTAENANARKKLQWGGGASSSCTGGWGGNWGDHSPPGNPP